MSGFFSRMKTKDKPPLSKPRTGSSSEITGRSTSRSSSPLSTPGTTFNQSVSMTTLPSSPKHLRDTERSRSLFFDDREPSSLDDDASSSHGEGGGYVSLFDAFETMPLTELLQKNMEVAVPEYHAEMIPDILINLNFRTARLPLMSEVIDHQILDSKASCMDQRAKLADLEEHFETLNREHVELQASVFAQLDEKIRMSENFAVLVQQLSAQIQRAARNVQRRSDISDPAQLLLLQYVMTSFEKASAASETVFLERTALGLKLEMMTREHELLQERLKQIRTLQEDIGKRFSSINERHTMLQTLIENTTILSDLLEGDAPISASHPLVKDAVPLYAIAAAPAASPSPSPLLQPAIAWVPMQPAIRGFSTNFIQDLSIVVRDPSLLISPDTMKLTTLAHLIIQLSERMNPEFQRHFLMTFRYFVSPSLFLRLVFIRFCLAAPIGQESRDSLATSQQPVQVRILAFLKDWMETRPSDFAPSDDSNSAAAVMRSMLSSTLCNPFPTATQMILTRLNNCENPSRPANRMIRASSTAPPPSPAFSNIVFVNDPSLLSSLSGSDFFGVITPLEAARQLCALIFERYSKVVDEEFFGLAWSKPGKEVNSPNLFSLTQIFNNISSWVVRNILAVEEMLPRARRIEWFIGVADELDRLNNLHGCLAVAAALQKASVFRLKGSWADVNPHLKLRVREILGLMQSNYKDLRVRIRTAKAPIVPYIGVYLTDLTFIIEGMPTYSASGFINWAKMRAIAERIDECLVGNATPYNFEIFQPVQRWLLDDSDILTDEEIDAFSIKLAEKEREELKAREMLAHRRETESAMKLAGFTK